MTLTGNNQTNPGYRISYTKITTLNSHKVDIGEDDGETVKETKGYSNYQPNVMCEIE